jgi:aldehyde dehydrogenase
VLNVVSNGFGVEAGKPLASSNPDRQDPAFTGETTTGRLIAVRAAGPGSRSRWSWAARAEHLFSDVLAAHDDYQDKALEGFMFARTGRGALPVAVLVQADIYDEFLGWRRSAPKRPVGR